jgi:type VI protein secretion system component Hcp
MSVKDLSSLAIELRSHKESKMRKVPAALLSLLIFAPVLAARPAKPASSAPPTPQAQCAAGNPARGEGKFNGQISGGPNGGPNASSIEVTSGNESVLVHYTNTVQVCRGGEPAPVSFLTHGANVVVYGPMQRIGKIEEMNATKIFIAGQPQRGTRGSGPVTGSNIDSNIDRTRGGSAPANNPNSGLGQSGADPINDPNSGRTQGGAQSTGGNDNYNSGTGQDGSDPGYGNQNNGRSQVSTSDPVGSSRGGRPQNSGGISCTSLQFSMNAPRDEHAGMGVGRPSVSGITCKMPVGQLALQLAHDALTGRRLGNVTLNLQNKLEVSLTNAEISSVQFTSDNDTPIVEVTFAYQKAEVVHLPSGTDVKF